MEYLYSSGTKSLQNKRIKGVLRVGTNYLIPKDAMKPIYTYVYESDDNTKSETV